MNIATIVLLKLRYIAAYPQLLNPLPTTRRTYYYMKSTATAASAMRAHIDGLEKKAAEEMRQLILSKIH